MMTPIGKGSLPRVGGIHPRILWPGSKLVQVIQMFLRLLSTFFPTSPTSMLRMSSSTNSLTSASQIEVEYNGSNDGCHDNKYSPRGSGQAHQRIHQLAWPRLWLSLMELMLGVLLASQSKSRQKSRRIVKKPKKLQRSEKFAKNIGSEKRLPKHRASVNKELELPLKLRQFFKLFLLSLEALAILLLL